MLRRPGAWHRACSTAVILQMPQASVVHRVLVVDDEVLIRWSVTETLGDQGFAVDGAATGADALDAVAAADGGFAAVVLDFRLPDSNDLGLLSKLRALMPATPIILMTAFSTPELVQGARDLGAFRVISKPFEMREIASLVTEACRRR